MARQSARRGCVTCQHAQHAHGPSGSYCRGRVKILGAGWAPCQCQRYLRPIEPRRDYRAS